MACCPSPIPVLGYKTNSKFEDSACDKAFNAADVFIGLKSKVFAVSNVSEFEEINTPSCSESLKEEPFNTLDSQNFFTKS